ncbi:hypothetical protein Poli38472_009342 [Pythium oligandrum]|uniref:Ankyrin repeat protein n=1 Tax=Pythium oligandrum TaxID=41045 RepID=A0A8K1FIN2_PYTOL|nr:hypothetical protein Poli38472_009342 [Pythium oligandrum]|eukprot:TMW65175.1 hypothetical protein Poli38472_009342 [Pythium oligandrum]
MEMTMETLRPTLLAAARAGDLTRVRALLYDPLLQPSMERMNATCRAHRETALATNQVPFVLDFRRLHVHDAWWTMYQPPMFWFRSVIDCGQLHVLSWFVSEEATELLGDTVRGILHQLCDAVMSASPEAKGLEAVEVLLSSYLFVHVLIGVERERVLMRLFRQALRSSGLTQTIDLLLAHGAPVTRTSRATSVTAQPMTAVQSLIANGGVDVEFGNVLADTAYGGNVDATRRLLDHGADTQYTGEQADALHVAVEEGKVGVTQLLLSEGMVDPNARDARGRTPLMMATIEKTSWNVGEKESDRLRIVQLLLDYGADVSPTDESGNTALHYATVGEHLDVVALLLSSGADPNVQNVYGDTALLDFASRIAVTERHYVLFDMLLAGGTDPFLQNAKNESFVSLLSSVSLAGLNYINERVQHSY